MSKYITIKDIANELGISKSTVSRALSGDASNVKAETMKLITETARRMGYQRNELAVSLRRQSSHNIAIIIPEIVTTFYMTFIGHACADHTAQAWLQRAHRYVERERRSGAFEYRDDGEVHG